MVPVRGCCWGIVSHLLYDTPTVLIYTQITRTVPGAEGFKLRAYKPSTLTEKQSAPLASADERNGSHGVGSRLGAGFSQSSRVSNVFSALRIRHCESSACLQLKP